MVRSGRLRVGSARFRVRPWQGDAETAYLVPLTEAPTMPPPVVANIVRRLTERGYRTVVTAPVKPPERDRLTDGGFTVYEELLVLGRELGPRPPSRPEGCGARFRPGHRRDIAEVLQLDFASFEPFWRFDAESLREARTATPASRWRVALTDGASAAPAVAGYCVTGRAGPDGYIQRLAVARNCRGRGIGMALVRDALWWLRRGGADNVSVNTQIGNRPALALYRRCGFTPEADRLAVLHRGLG